MTVEARASFSSKVARLGASIAHFIRGGKPPPETRKSPHFWMNVVAGTGLFFYLLLSGFGSRFMVGIADQDVRCLPGRLFLVSKVAPQIDEIQRGKIYAYLSKGLEPLLPDGSIVGKIAAGLPGDEVVVDASGIWINGTKWGDINPQVMRNVGLALPDIQRSYVIGEGQALFLGTLPRSYDGRYLGPVSMEQVQGRAWRLI